MTDDVTPSHPLPMTPCHVMTPLTRSPLTRARVWLIDTNVMSQPVILSPIEELP
jgi:hypothetical protein